MLSLLALAMLVPVPGQAAVSRSGGGDLSPRLADLASPAVSSAPPARQARELSLAPSGPGSLLREGNRVLVDVRFERGAAAAVGRLRAAGAKIVNVSSRYQTVTIAVRPDGLERLSAVAGVAGASPVLAPIASASTCPAGASVSEGDLQLRAAEARSSFGLDGSGITVGVLSDSYDQAEEAADESGPVASDATADVESGDLPGVGNTCTGQSTPVDVRDDSEVDGGDEGRAMAQIVHDLAPGAGLAFATAFGSETGFAENIEELAKSPGEGGAGAKVLVDDVAWFGEPFFQEGPVGVAVGKAVAGGAVYLSAAGNNNLMDGGRNIGSWEAPAFRDASCPAGLPSYAVECMDFAPGAATDPTFGIGVAPGVKLRLDLQWAQPWNGVTTDLDAYLLNASGEVVRESEEFNVASSQRPFEFLSWTNTASVSQTVRLAVDRCSSTSCDPLNGGDTASPRLKFALLQNGGGVTGTEYESSSDGDVVGPTVFGHAGGTDAIAVGAIQFNATEAPQQYSSRGPVTRRFGPVEGSTAAGELDPPLVISKPDLTASDCNVTTFFAFKSGLNWRFCGTSAAAPHAAAVAALLLQKEPAATPAQIRAALAESAGPIGAFGPCAVGAGLLDAAGAVARLLAPQPGSPPACLPPESPATEEESSGDGNGGSTPQTPVEPVLKAPDVSSPPTPRPRPDTFVRRGPAKTLRTSGGGAKAVFVFGSDQRGVVFLCKFDRGSSHVCPAHTVRRFGPGPHLLRVKARNGDGRADTTPAFYRFRVRRVG